MNLNYQLNLFHCGFLCRVFNFTAFVLLSGALLHQPIATAAILNGDFEAYTNTSPASDITVSAAVPASWVETGAGGHTLIGDQFGDFMALSDPDGSDDADPNTPYAAWLTQFNEGIYQPFPTSAGVSYYIDFVFGQIAPEVVPRILFTVFNDSGVGGVTLLDGFVDANADFYGDGNVTGSYVLGFTATGNTSTILFALGENLSSKSEGVGIDNVSMSVVPEPATQFLLLETIGVLVLLVVRSRKFQGRLWGCDVATWDGG